jgi:hypothetical protein
MSSTEFTFSDSTSIAPIRKKNVGGRPKSIVWETHAKQGKKISQGHYEATCIYCDFFWRKGSPQDLESHFANNCPKVPDDTRQFFLNRLAAKAEEDTTNLSAKKRKLNDNTSRSQTKISEFHESTNLSNERIHEIDRACIKAFVVCGIAWHIIENPFFIEFLKTLRPGYVPPSKEVLSGRLLAQETAVINQKIIQELKSTENLTLSKFKIN